MLVIGETLIDILESDDHGEPAETVGGSPANVALGLGRIGERVRLHTALAADRRGGVAAAHLERSGVRIDPRSYSLERTSTALVRRAENGDASYAFDIRWEVDRPELRGEEVVHVGSIACALEPGAAAVVEFLGTVPDHAIVTFDPNIRPALMADRRRYMAAYSAVLARADVVKMSDEDARWIYPGRDAAEVLGTLLRGRAALAVITGGERGAWGAVPGGTFHVSAPRVRVADTVGAGDTFMASLIGGVLGLERAPTSAQARAIASRAAVAASITASRRGADLPTEADIAMALASSDGRDRAGSPDWP